MELATLGNELTGSKAKIITKPLPVDDPARRRPDITLAKKHLSWQPQVKLKEGLARTIDRRCTVLRCEPGGTGMAFYKVAARFVA